MSNSNNEIDERVASTEDSKAKVPEETTITAATPSSEYEVVANNNDQEQPSDDDDSVKETDVEENNTEADGSTSESPTTTAKEKTTESLTAATPIAAQDSASTPPSPQTDQSNAALADTVVPTWALVTPEQPAMPKKVPISDHPDAITLKFIFANRDGLYVMVSCKVTDSVGEVKGVLMSMWPDDLSPCSEGDRLRLICMGKGILMPDTKSLAACEVPVFKTHATPINVSVRPLDYILGHKGSHKGGVGSPALVNADGASSESGVQQGCFCTIL